jgi:hypothetical protein
MVLRPLRPLGQVGMARVDRAAKVAEAQRRAAIDVLWAGDAPFSAASSGATISKMALKPAQGGGRRVKKETHLRGYNEVVTLQSDGIRTSRGTAI